MKIHVAIEQIDNGFIVSLFDEDGLAEHDQKVFIENFVGVLKRIDDWTSEIVEREATDDEEEA